MNIIHRLPDAEAAERQAADWVARLNSDEVSDSDRASFEAWRGAHPRHARAYDELLATWRELREAGHIVRAVSFGAAMNAASSFPSLPIRRQRVRVRGVLLAATMAAVAIAVAAWFFHIAPGTQFQTAIGEHAAIQLPDGSSLELNSNSLARVEYSAGARVIRLKRGEAYFKVAHDTQRPFWVVAENSWVRAVGTAFNVYMHPAGVQVTVSEGIVKVATDRVADATPTDAALISAPVSILTAGQQVQLTGDAADIRSLGSAELTRSVAWREGVLYFENQPLGAVIDEMARYTPMQILIEDPHLRGLPIGGTFQANPQGAQALLAMLQDGLGLHVRRDGSKRAYVSSATSPH